MELDFLGAVDQDVAVKILMCLDDPGDIVHATSVSRSWRDFVIANGIGKHLCIKLFPQLSGITRIIDVSNPHEKVVDVGCSRSIEWDNLKKEHRAFTSLARVLSSSEVGECHSHAISASSTDNYPEENVRNTLESRDRIGRRASYWSSSGQSRPEVPERLTYKLTSDLCVITEINVQPFQAFFQANSPIYSAKAVRFRMGHEILADGDRDFTSNECPPSANEKFSWTYTSPEFPMAQENCLQNFKLPKPVLCVGGILQIELLGRVQRQEMDYLFYICISYVQIMGHSLAPVFGIESIEASGRFSVLYNPQAELSSPHASHEEGDESTEMVPTNVRGWEQILNVLRAAVGVEIYDSEEDEQHESDEEMAEEELPL